VIGNIVAVAVIPFVGNLSEARIDRVVALVDHAPHQQRHRDGERHAVDADRVEATRYRVSAMAISQNIGTAITAMLPALFATVAPPGRGRSSGRGRSRGR
jgi:hypothetical protein